MNIFMTGATGYVGSLVAKELISDGFTVSGLTRSEKSAQKLTDMGGKTIMGTLSNLDIIKDASKQADAVLHLGFTNDFAHFDQAALLDKNAILAIGDAIKDTDKPFLITAGTAGVDPGEILTENDLGSENYAETTPRKSELLARQLKQEGLNTATVRFAPSVHGAGRYGLISMLINQSNELGYIPYIGNGQNRWNAVNVNDAAHLFVLVLKYKLNGGPMTVFNAVGDGQVKMIDILNILSKKLELPIKPVKANYNNSFNILQSFSADLPASSILTQRELGWNPTHINLIDDLSSNL